MRSVAHASNSPTSDRPLRLRCRPDLESRSVLTGSRRRWNIRDPIALRYYQLDEAEHMVLRALDGATSLSDIQSQVERAFAPRRLALTHLQSFLTLLHREGLVIADVSKQGPELLERQTKQRRRQRWATWANPLAIRFPGVDPTAMLDWLYPKCRWLFAWVWLALVATSVAAVGVLFLTQKQTVQARLPELRELASAGNIAAFALAIAFAKVLHELGHALTCRHFGGRCHEMGVMLLVFTPCLYSNVSQAWMIPEKWRRIAVSGAGIVVELALAAICGLLWWFSEPGFFNAICLHLTLVCSIGTVLLNGNPLLRFDGYYILSDWLESPNLGQRSTTALRQAVMRHVAGVDPPDDRLGDARNRGWLLTYAVLSLGYRLFLTAGILGVIYVALKPHGLAIVAQALMALVAVSMIFRPALDTWSFLRDPARSKTVNWRRFTAFCAIFIGGAIALGSIPLPYNVVAEVTVEPRGARRVFVPVAGILQSAASPGEAVKSGDKLARLISPALELELARLEERCAEQRLLVDLLTRQRIADADAANDLPTAREVLRELDKLRDQRREEWRRLTITATQSGIVFPPPARAAAVGDDSNSSSSASDPLDESSRGMTLEVGSQLCVVGDADRWEAIAIIDESSIPLVREGQNARVQLDALPGVILQGAVRHVAELEVDENSPDSAPPGNKRAIARGGTGALKGTRYQAVIDLESTPETLLFGAKGRAKIEVQPRSLGRRLLDLVRQTFSFTH